MDFTGQRQDTETGLYDFLNREYSLTGRWIAPDPSGLNAVDITSPQTWNRYAYVVNNPMTLTDPFGLNPGGPGGGNGCQGYACTGNSSGAWGINCYPGQPCGGAQCNLDGVAAAPCQLAYGVSVSTLLGSMNMSIDQIAGAAGGQWTAVQSLVGGAPLDPTFTFYPADADDSGNSGTFLGWDSNAWGTFAGSLFSWKNFKAEFKSGGCVNVFMNEMAGTAGSTIAGRDRPSRRWA